MADLKTEFRRYQVDKADYPGEYPGRYIVLMDGVVLGSYATALDAALTTAKDREPGTFLVQLVTTGDDVVRFHSRRPMSL